MNNFKMKTVIKRSAAFVLSISILAACLVMPVGAALADERRTIKVAYFNLGDYYKTKSGRVDSYDSAYLTKISKYSQLNFEFVNCGTWSNALDLLKKHKVDLVGTMQYTADRAKEFSICKSPYGVTFSTLATKKSNDIVYEDYNSIDKSIIGCTEQYVNRTQLDNLLESKGISPRIETYPSQVELDTALENNKVDMIAVNSHAVSHSMKILEKYNYSDYYFASWKGNTELTNAIDEALIKINMYDGDFVQRTMDSYFGEIVNEPFTMKELDFAKTHKAITVYFEPDTEPLAYLDDTGKMTGILIDICNMISQSTGLKFNYDSVKNKKADEKCITFNTDFYSPASGISTSSNNVNTKSFFDSNFSLYRIAADGAMPDDGNAHTVVIPNNRMPMANYIENKYPDFTIAQCENPKECIELLESGDADFMFANVYVANAILKRSTNSSIELLPNSVVSGGIQLNITTDDADTIGTIIDKAIDILDNKQCDQIILNYTSSITPDSTLNYFLDAYLLQFVIMTLVLLVVIFCIIFAVARNRMFKKRQQLLADANDKLISASAAKSEFLSHMSHDIRTPMNAIIGLTDIALDRDDNPTETEDCLKKIDSSSRFLLGLINDVLNMSKIENKSVTLKPEPYDYEDFKRQVNIFFDSQCDENGIDFKIELDKRMPKCISVDKVRLNQIIFNLLSNAVKYTPVGGKVNLIIKLISKQDDWYNTEIIVEDTGIGIDKEFQEHMFEPFSQSDSKHVDESSGSGLGLAIVKNLVSLMGGSIEVKSEVGVGTKFSIMMRFKECEPPIKTSYIDTLDTERYILGRRFLVSEDNQINAGIIKRLLEKAKGIVDVTYNGEDCLDAFSNSEPGEYSMIIMDIRMPVMNGLDAAKEIRSLKRDDAKDVPIIALTANAFDEDREKTKEAGMNAHLSKPIDPDMFYHTIIKYISNYID